MNEVYNGISAKLYYEEGKIRYDFIVEPNADPNQIELEFDGADDVIVNENNELVV